jgi:HPt (histidine-containing phosphotransfer) domain-containing protein
MAVLDTETFWENYSELKDVLPSLIGQFKKSYPESLKKIVDALSRQDSEALRSSAHGLKGMLLQLYAPDSSSLALQLEKLGKEKKFDGATEQFKKLISDLKLLEAALDEILKKDLAA